MNNITIGFTGDVAFSEYTKNLYKEPEKIDKSIYNFLNSNDYNIINFESPITNFLKTKKETLAHRSDLDSLRYIKNTIKNPILNLANNHMMDFGYKGLTDTINNVKSENIKYIGAGEDKLKATDYIILGDEVKVGLISFQYKDYFIATNTSCGTAHEKHKNIIKKKIKELRKKVDWVVIVYHGGDEFINVPMPYVRKKLKKFLKWGADVLVAHHPHTVQGYEKIKSKTIFYSLGNFIFDTNYQRAQKGTEYGELIRITFNKENYEFTNLNLYNDRKDNKIKVIDSYEWFKDIKIGYKKKWKAETFKFAKIKKAKKDLKKYQKKFSIDGIYIEKVSCENYITFEELVKKHYFEGIDNKVVSKNRIIRKIRKIKRIFSKVCKINYKKHICILYAKIFK